MRNFLLILSGFVLTLAVFAGGALFAVQLLAVEPVHEQGPGRDSADLWTNEAVVVASNERFERLPARLSQPSGAEQTQPAATDETLAAPASEPMVDTMTTASVQPGEARATDDSAVLDAAHLEWCANRYRSYRPKDNSYTSYSGQQRECVSPYSQGGSPEMGRFLPEDRPEMEFVVVGELQEDSEEYLTAEHIRSCFSRYRSYRPEDNSYQPYNGGPRRQCR